MKKRVLPLEGKAATTRFIFMLEKASINRVKQGNCSQWSHYWWCCRAAGRFSTVASNEAEVWDSYSIYGASFSEGGGIVSQWVCARRRPGLLLSQCAACSNFCRLFCGRVTVLHIPECMFHAGEDVWKPWTKGLFNFSMRCFYEVLWLVRMLLRWEKWLYYCLRASNWRMKSNLVFR